MFRAGSTATTVTPSGSNRLDSCPVPVARSTTSEPSAEPTSLPHPGDRIWRVAWPEGVVVLSVDHLEAEPGSHNHAW